MPLSLVRWAIPVLLLLLLAPLSVMGEEGRRLRAKGARKQVSSKQLVRLPGGKALRRDAAAAFERMRTAAREEGVSLWVTSGYRSRSQQRWLYRRYRQGLGPQAARPGRSNHQRGIAVDLFVGEDTSLTYEWLEAHACRFGFRRTVRSEPWHWEYRPRTTRAPRSGYDCLDQPLVPLEVPPEVAAPGSS